MPRRKRARPKEKEDDQRDVPRKRQHGEDDGETVIIVDSEEEEEFRHRDREKKPGMLSKDHIAHGPEMTEEDMLNLAMKLSEQEAKSTTLQQQQQQEDEAMKKAIAESLHTNGIQSDNGAPELVALVMTRRSPVSSDHESSPAPQSPVFPARKKSLHLKQSNTHPYPSPGDEVTTLSYRKKRHPNSRLTQRSELHRGEPPGSSVCSLVPEKENSLSQKNYSRSNSPHQEAQGTCSCHTQSESNIFDPMKTSPVHSPILCITKLSQDLVEDCQATGYILCSQKLTGCLETSQAPRSSQHESPKLPESSTFPRMDMGKRQKVTTLEGRGLLDEDLCLESSDISKSLLSRVKMLSLSQRRLLKEQTPPGERKPHEQVYAGLSQSEEEVCLRSMNTNTETVQDSTGKQTFLQVTSDSDAFCTKMELHWSDDDEEDNNNHGRNDLTKMKTGLICSHQELQSTAGGGSPSSDLYWSSSPVFPQEALCSVRLQGCVTAVSHPAETANTSEVQQKSTAVPSGQSVTSVDHPTPLVEKQGAGVVHYYWGVPFCPHGLDPDDYTRAILAQLEVYEKSLKEARRGLLRKATWGDPVVPGPAEAPLSRRGRPKRFCPPQRLPDEEDEEEEDEEENDEEKTIKVMEVAESQEGTGSPRGSEAGEKKTGETKGDDSLVPSPLPAQENTPLKKLSFHKNPRRLRKQGLRDSSLMEKEMSLSEVQDEEEDMWQETELRDENTPELIVQNPEETTVHTAKPRCREFQQEQSGLTEKANSEQRLQQMEEDVDAGTEEAPGTPELLQCPICMHNFPLAQIEMHAAYCDGSPEGPFPEEPSTQVRSLRSSRRLEVLDEDQPNSSSGKAQHKEKCFICKGMFSVSEYKQHVDDCVSCRTVAVEGPKKLLVALDQSEQKRSAGPSESTLKKKRKQLSNSPIDESAAGKKAQSTGFQGSSSPVRTFTPISEITDCLIDFKRQLAPKPSQRRGCKKKFK